MHLLCMVFFYFRKMEIINLKIKDIIGEYDHFNIKKNKNIEIYKPFYYYIKEFFFMLLFWLLCLPLTLFFHKNCFNYFFKKIKDDIFSPTIYKDIKNNLLGRVILFLISLLFTIFFPIILLSKILEVFNKIKEENNYDWDSLYESLKDNYYLPNKYKDGYIVVENFKNMYKCREGNHRLILLRFLYGHTKVITVKKYSNI